MYIYIMRILFNILFLLCISVMIIPESVHAQSIAPQSINSAGAKFSQNNSSLSFTIGNLRVSSSMDNEGNSLSEGFTNESVNSTTLTTIKAPLKDELNVSIYPNPTSDFVILEIIDTKLEWIYIDILDPTGKLISSEKYSGLNNKIGLSTSGLPNGIYTLNLTSKDNSKLGIYNLLIK